jgi:hypothetical protein
MVMTMRARACCLWVAAVAACSSHPAPAQVEPAPAAPAPAAPAAAPAACAVTLRAALGDKRGATFDVEVSLENRGEAALELELADRCPQGSVDFAGLPAGYDYYGTCAAGACPGERAPRRVRIDRGATRQLEAITIDPAGSGCNRPLAAGAYELRPILDGVPAGTCVEGVTLAVAAPTPAPAKPAPAKPTPAEPTPARPASAESSVDPRACTAAADCVLFCPRVKGCCGFPCGCRNAVHRDQRDAFTAAYAKSCERHPDCPAMACRLDDAERATCQNGRCVAVDGL